jgi:N-acetylmuramoyl-L-alanine amidase
MPKIRWTLFCLLLLLTAFPLRAQQRYLEVAAQPGDGVFSLLRRFYLNTPCNLAQFYQLNGVRKGQGLKARRSYKLPIFLYPYNGSSIRSTTGVNDYDWAVGVQEYNDFMWQQGLKAGDYRKDKELWVPYHKLYCRSEDEQINFVAGSGSAAVISDGGSQGSGLLRGTYDIFGPEYAKVPLESTTLNGRVYYVVAGHGGPDPGAVGAYGGHSLCEDEYAYDVGLRLTRNLLAHGATVYLIVRDPDDGIRETEILPCDKDETVWVDQKIPVSQAERLQQRSDVINALYQKNRDQGVGYQRLITIHVDSDRANERLDVYFYHKADDLNSFQLATTLQQTMREKYEEYRKGRGYEGSVSSRDLHMLRETEPTSVFIELGNIKNRNDQARLIIPGNRQLIADWLFAGLVR